MANAQSLPTGADARDRTPVSRRPRLHRGVMRPSTRRMLGVVGIVGLVVGWHLLAVSGLFARILMPTPGEILGKWVEMAQTGELEEATWASTLRVVEGVAIGVILAIPVGLVLAWFSVVHAVFEPLLNFFRAVPPIALIPLVVVYLGIGEDARVFILAWAAFFVATIVIYEGTVAIDPVMVQAAQILGASQREVLVKVVLPLTVPTILVALRVAVYSGWGTLVASELLAAQTGLGATISQAANYFMITKIYASIVTIGLLAVTMDQITRAAMLRLVSWQERVQR